MDTSTHTQDRHTGQEPPLALYVHWPFCVSKCPYCDFNSHVRETVDHELWCRALLTDMTHEADQLQGRTIGSIFFGGGTPSLMPPATVASLIQAAEELWGFTNNVEITLEANPSSVEAARFADLAAAGVNRVSLGLQALDDAALAFLGRAHSVQEGLSALDTAQAIFKRVSFDLIYARPQQSKQQWAKELQQALAFGTEHLSLYQLTIEPGTRFAALAASGALETVDPDHGAELYELTQDMMSKAGLPAYEISNHARPGAQSRHNLAYWLYHDYAGIGPGAHGRRSGLATVRHKKPENWLNAIGRNGHGCQAEDALSPAERAREAMVMGLRLAEGINLDAVARRCGVERETIVCRKSAGQLEALGLLRQDGHNLRVTPKGMLLLDHILGQLVET